MSDYKLPNGEASIDCEDAVSILGGVARKHETKALIAAMREARTLQQRCEAAEQRVAELEAGGTPTYQVWRSHDYYTGAWAWATVTKEEYEQEPENTAIKQILYTTPQPAPVQAVPEGFVRKMPQLRDGFENWELANIGDIAMQFVDRAGDFCPQDPAETICAEFHQAVSDYLTGSELNAAPSPTSSGGE